MTGWGSDEQKEDIWRQISHLLMMISVDCSTCFLFMHVKSIQRKIVYITVHQSGQWPFMCGYNIPSFKGTVHRELRWVKIGINWTATKIWIAVYHAPRDTIRRGAQKYLAAVVFFDAILTGWVSKHNSVGLIPLQRPCSDAVAAQRQSIPKCNEHSPTL